MKKIKRLYHYVVSFEKPLRPQQLSDELRFVAGLKQPVVGITDLQCAGPDVVAASALRRGAAMPNPARSIVVQDAVDVLPFHTLFDTVTDEVLLIRDAKDPCFMADGMDGACDPSELRYRIGDITEPSYCARHFYRAAVAGDGISWFRLTDEPQPVVPTNQPAST